MDSSLPCFHVPLHAQLQDDAAARSSLCHILNLPVGDGVGAHYDREHLRRISVQMNQFRSSTDLLKQTRLELHKARDWRAISRELDSAQSWSITKAGLHRCAGKCAKRDVGPGRFSSLSESNRHPSYEVALARHCNAREPAAPAQIQLMPGGSLGTNLNLSQHIRT